MSGKLKKKFFMKPNNLFKFFVNFFYSIKNIYFPDILQHFKQKKNFLYISKKKSSLDASIFAKKFCSIIAILKFFYSKLRNMSGKLKKKFFMKPNNLFKFFVNFFYSIKNIYFPDILPHFKQKKNFLYISKKKSSLDASIFAKNFCSIIAILKKNFILNCVICREN